MPVIIGDPSDQTIYGTTVADDIRGGGGDDVIIGQGGADLLYGEEGDDTFVTSTGRIDGGAGVDTLRVLLISTANNIWESHHDGGFIYTYLNGATSQVGYVIATSVEIIYGSGFRDYVYLSMPYSFTFHGGEGSDFFFRVAGGPDRNYYYGEEGDDIFDESGPAIGHYYDGGVGDDYFRIYGGLGTQVVGGEGFDTVEMDLSSLILESETIDLSTGGITWKTGYENSTFQTFTFSGVEQFVFQSFSTRSVTILGTDDGDVIVMGGTNNGLNGDTYNRVYGGRGDDTLLGVEDGASSVTGHWLSGGDGDDLVMGGIGDDHLFGDAGDDVILGGRDNDEIDGGDGFDIASYENASGRVEVSLLLGGQQNTQSGGLDRLAGIEGLIGSSFDDILTGNDLDNLFIGGLGDDTLNGGLGHDTVSYVDATAGVSIDLRVALQSAGAAGRDTLQDIENLQGSRFADTLIGNGVANDLRGGDGDDILRGMDGDDVIGGGAGDDVIDGGAGEDLLDGGEGFDTISYAAALASVSVNLGIAVSQSTGAGWDTLRGFESVVGSAFDDVLTGGDGDDVLEGAAGSDTLTGGAGLDLASYASATAAVTVSLAASGYQSTGGAGSDHLSGIEGLIGSNFNDRLTGDASDNVLEGGLGDDILDGAGGLDSASYARSTRSVTIDLALTGQQNTGAGSGRDTLINIENVIGSRFTDVIYGNEAANVIDGRGGANDGVISGGDNIFGRGGDDIIIMGSGGGVADGGTGNDLIYGGSDGDNLYGGSGDDIIDGGAGGDVIFGGAGINILFGGDGNDTLTGIASSDTLDYLYGGRGSDDYQVTSGLTGPQVLVDEGEGNPLLAGGADDIDRIVSRGEFFWDYYSVAEILMTLNTDGSQLVGGKNVMNKTINGWVGDDIIVTYGRSSVVDAGAGTDAISFGLLGLDESYDGVNTLIMQQGSGTDYLYDFESGVDKIDLSRFSYGLSGDQWKAFLVDVDNGDEDYCFLYLGSPGDYLVFVGLTSADLRSSDFIGG